MIALVVGRVGVGVGVKGGFDVGVGGRSGSGVGGVFFFFCGGVLVSALVLMLVFLGNSLDIGT